MYAERLMTAGERLHLARHPHPISVLRIALLGLLMIVAAGGLTSVAHGLAADDPAEWADALELLGPQPDSMLNLLALGLFAGSLLACLVAWLTWRSTEYAVISGPEGGKLLRVQGILNKQTIGAPLDKVNDLILLEPLLGRLLGYGDIQVKTGNDYAGQLLTYVPDARSFYNVCRSLRPREDVRMDPAAGPGGNW